VEQIFILEIDLRQSRSVRWRKGGSKALAFLGRTAVQVRNSPQPDRNRKQNTEPRDVRNPGLLYAVIKPAVRLSCRGS
jgi:hypothetical protein